MLRYDIDTVSAEVVEKLIKTHSTARFKKLDNYYRGNHDILHRTMEDPTKPNNKLVANFAQYISDMISGYFMGESVTLSCEDEKLHQMIRDIENYNDQAATDSELALTASIKSVAYELLYLDEEQHIRSAALQPDHVIYVYDTAVNPQPVLAVYHYNTEDLLSGENTLHVFAYTDTELIEYVSGKEGFVQIDRADHYWGQVPIIEYMNPSGLGDFERAITLIDAYNTLNSDSVNNHEYFADAYLMLTGMMGTESDDVNVKVMKENRVLALGEGSTAGFLVKPSVEADLELLKDRLIADIHTFTGTPNLRDEAFSGSISGVALQYKLFGLEQYVALKERMFKKSIQRRLEIICYMLEKKGFGSFDYRKVEILFTRNTPQNLKELADIVGLLFDKAPREDLLALLPFVTDPQAAAEEAVDEK